MSAASHLSDRPQNERSRPQDAGLKSNRPVIVWFRRDLRISDNPALQAAIASQRKVIALYIYESDVGRAYGGASLWWLHYSLQALSEDIARLGGVLVKRKGSANAVLNTLIAQSDACAVYWNRRYSAPARRTDTAIMESLKDRNIEVQSFRANLLSEPWEIKTKTGGYYKVFTPYWRAVTSQAHVSLPLPAPDTGRFVTSLATDTLDDWKLLPRHSNITPDWGGKLAPYWQPGSAGARQALEHFIDGPIETYAESRNRPDNETGTSRLSAHLAFGEISPREIWHACLGGQNLTSKYLAEIGWREFSYVLLFHNPDLATRNFKPYFDNFEWEHNPAHLRAWQKGQTGYPFVDAGMRQLWQTGWQHNRVRMVTASFLIKHLLLDWRLGEAWFHDTLVDADPASNAASWQWVAGSGADASPYFRIFNPFSQGEKFDPNGDYVRKFVPEIAALPTQYIHRPWEAPEDVLAKVNVTLGQTYPRPIVEHKMARTRALAAYKACRIDGLKA